MGLLDNELRPHLDAITQYYRENEDFLISSYESSKITNLFKESDESKRLKINNTAEKFRQKGKEFFKAKDVNAALQLFTKSIAAAIKGPFASLAYFNRSAVLYHMKLFEDCIQDIDRALENGYPKKQQLYRLHLRRAKCLKFLNKDYVSCLADAMKAITDHNVKDETKRLSELVRRGMKEPPLPDLKDKLPKSNVWKLPELSYGANLEVPSYSSAVDLRHSKELRRHLVANRCINTGDVLVVEKSVVTSTYFETQWNFCNFCLKHCYALIPCKNYCGKTVNSQYPYVLLRLCIAVSYCQNFDGSTAHKEECKINLVNEVPLGPTLKIDEFTEPSISAFKYSHVAITFRLIACIGLENIKKTAFENQPLKSFEDPRTKGFHDGKLEKATLEALLSLEDNFEKLTREEIDKACKGAFLICGLLDIAPKDWLPIGAIFLKLRFLLQFNCTSMEHFKANYIYSDMSKLPTLQVASGLFLASSLINHSCNANANPFFYGNWMVIRATNPIRKGEQITICYTLPASEQSLQERQEILIKYYKFKCSCVACVSDVFSTFSNYLPIPPRAQLEVWLEEAGVELTCSPLEAMKVMLLCLTGMPAPMPIMPWLLRVLKSCHNVQSNPNKWYYNLNTIIQNHYRTQGNCFFFGDAEKILTGEMDIP